MMLALLVYLLRVASAITEPSDPFQDQLNKGELRFNDNAHHMNILRYGIPQAQRTSRGDFVPRLSDIFDENNKYYKIFMHNFNRGHINKGLTFNIYDRNMREPAVALFYMLKNVDKDKPIDTLRKWAERNINYDLFDYVWRLSSLYHSGEDKRASTPPFLRKPNYFINGEAIYKALRIQIDREHFHQDEAKTNDYFRTNDIISINVNYSEWNKIQNGCINKMPKYFTEDISLNSYYYGLHLLHPFWMSNAELAELNPRHTEHFYFAHRQLMARYLLEKEHIEIEMNCSIECENIFNSYLVHDNGLPFPIRLNLKVDQTSETIHIQSIDITIREVISSGVISMANGTIITMTEDNYIDVLTQLIRRNLDNTEMAERIRSLYGYGQNGYPKNKYNSAPSLMHFPETSLRDPVYWLMIDSFLNYFSEFAKSLELYKLSDHETDDFRLVRLDYSKVSTYFHYYKFCINQALGKFNRPPFILSARQKRLTHKPFTMNFTIDSKKEEKAVIRIFLGPRNFTTKEYHRFYQLDVFELVLNKGIQTISWPAKRWNSLSDDQFFNLETPMPDQNLYNIFKFPRNLLIPKGTAKGLDLTLFVIITPANSQSDNLDTRHIYGLYTHEVDKKPLGFPFHRQVSSFNYRAHNYKFYNISVYHKKDDLDNCGYFSFDLD